MFAVVNMACFVAGVIVGVIIADESEGDEVEEKGLV